MAAFNRELKIWESEKVSNYLIGTETYFGELILEKLSETPTRICQISVEENTELSCDELRIKSIRVAQNLTKIGIKSGDVVGIICRHSHELTMALFGCVLTGAPVNPLDLSFTKDDIKHLYQQTNPKIVICDSDQVTKIREALNELGNDAKIYSITYGDENKQELNFKDLLTPTGDEETFVSPKFNQPSDKKVLAILCSSGTTGLPKGVMISHLAFRQWSAMTPSQNFATRSVCFSPFFWGSGFFPHIFIPITANDTRIMPREGFSVDKLTEIVAKFQPTDMTIPPMNLSLILQSDFPRSVNHEFLKNITALGSIVSETLREKFADLFPEKNLKIVYGMTEYGVSITSPGDYKQKLCVGSPIFPNSAFKIVDEDGYKLGVNEVGEICIKSKIKFLGYYNNPEITKNSIDDEGFFKSGDIGYIDENGKFYVIDRKKEIVKCRGYQINLSEIESLIETISGVKFVSVVGIPDPIYDTLPAAVIVKKIGFESLTEKSIMDYVASKLPIYKQLASGVYFVDQMPTTPSGKIKKRAVSEIVLSRIKEN